MVVVFFFQAEDGIRGSVASRGLGEVYKRQADASHAQATADPAIDLVAMERGKIKGAVRTDFILSAEIIVIALGTVFGSF